MFKKSIDIEKDKNIFSKNANKYPRYILFSLTSGLAFVVFCFVYWFNAANFNVGYAPEQPIPYSHRLHAGELGIDCRYCHNSVESSHSAGVPSAETCMNCHKFVKTESPHIVKVREHYTNNEPIEWVRVHQLPDYSYFNHSAHVNKGVGCVECHGRVDQMDVVWQAERLSMGWCLECHREPESRIRPIAHVTDMDWDTEDREALGKELIKAYHIQPREDCNTCHR